jgi:hypothetical protein
MKYEVTCGGSILGRSFGGRPWQESPSDPEIVVSSEHNGIRMAITVDSVAKIQGAIAKLQDAIEEMLDAKPREDYSDVEF